MGQQIIVESGASVDRQNELGVTDWPVWEKEISRFPWSYDASETCYLISGEVIVTPDGGHPVTIRAGDIATFPSGMKCEWNVVKPLRKHYRFS